MHPQTRTQRFIHPSSEITVDVLNYNSIKLVDHSTDQLENPIEGIVCSLDLMETHLMEDDSLLNTQNHSSD